MESFHYTRRESRVLNAIGLLICFVLASVFMLLGFNDLLEHRQMSGLLVLGVIGLGLFVIFMRGAWMLCAGTKIHVFSIDPHTVTWGYVGNEKSQQMSEVINIYWDDTDGFTFNMTTSSGELIRFNHLDWAIPYKSRWKLLRYLKKTFPGIAVDGHVDPKTREKMGSI